MKWEPAARWAESRRRGNVFPQRCNQSPLTLNIQSDEDNQICSRFHLQFISQWQEVDRDASILDKVFSTNVFPKSWTNWKVSKTRAWCGQAGTGGKEREKKSHAPKMGNPIRGKSHHKETLKSLQIILGEWIWELTSLHDVLQTYNYECQCSTSHSLDRIFAKFNC